MCRKLASFVWVLGLLLTNVAEGVDPTLVGWWKFDDGSGTTAIDSSGNGFNIRLSNTTWKDGVFGDAVHFHGVGHGYVGNFKYSDNAITVCAWVWHDAFRIGKFERYVTMAAPEVTGIRKNGDGRLQFYIQTDGNLQHLQVRDVLTEGQWHHVAGTWDGRTQRLYIDGVEIAWHVSHGVLGDTSNVRTSSVGQPLNGMLDEVRIYNRALTQDEIQIVMQGKEWPFAFGPEPADGTLHTNTWVSLSWSPGAYAVSHDVYLGENFEDVNEGTSSTFQGNQTETHFVVGYARSPYLAPGTTYFWRIDEVNNLNRASPWKGDVWSFWIPYKTAYDPYPVDDIDFIDPNVTLSWTPGFGARLHTVYFGDNFDDVNDATGGTPQGPTTYTPGPLAKDTIYYWRVDEFDGSATHKGDVWTFTTVRTTGEWTYDGGILVGVYYYPWYRPMRHSVSNSLRRHLVPQQTAELGEYDSSSPAVIAKHIDYSHRANIHFWACRWRGRGSQDDYVLRYCILPHSYAGELKYTIIYASPFGLGDEQNPDYANWLRDFEYLASNYFDNPNWLKIDGRPVVFIYVSRLYFNEKRGYPELEQLREAHPNLYLIADHVDGNFNSARASKWDAVTVHGVTGKARMDTLGSTHAALEQLESTYDEVRAVCNRVNVGFVPGAGPGRNDRAVKDRPGHNSIPRYFEDDPTSVEGDLFRAMLRDVVVPKHVDPLAQNMLVITSFNEWHEDTQIEPTTGTGATTNVDDSHSGSAYTQGDHYTDYGYLYLDILREETSSLEDDSLSEALDTDLSFTTGGSEDWFYQTATSYYGGDAAQSGNISDEQDSWIQTTVSGTGTVKFCWKVSSEDNFDFLEFYIDDSLQDQVSGSVGWQQKTYTITTSGSHTLEWRYVKDDSNYSGSDCGWVDKVEWVTN